VLSIVDLETVESLVHLLVLYLLNTDLYLLNMDSKLIWLVVINWKVPTGPVAVIAKAVLGDVDGVMT